ncbi:DNA-directed RNA polymerase II subunit GRINL1 [Cinara cedri]|uniref:DNA-directed RNA polymerase II subunit GRINL1 n=1 Tax=Cinara cedri TaxID=506608 RepID=A0A5E4M801_9HEMI|nr:DNA-directed RNA polymerase II subunit GRINL1 [Cinara cedri]
MFATKLKTNNENKVNFKDKTYAELQELLERQNKIINNKRFVDGLPDKGEKLKHFRAQLEIELDKHQIHKKLCEDMCLLNIGKDQLDTLEWTGKHIPSTLQMNTQPNVNNSDEDVLKMFVSHSGICQDKIIIKEIPEKPLIKPSDLIDEVSLDKSKLYIESQKFPEKLEPYAKNLCGRFDTNIPVSKRHILLNKPAKPNKSSTVKALSVSLAESVMLQHSQDNKLKIIKEENLKSRQMPKFDYSSYRESTIFNTIHSEDDSDSDISISSITEED